MKLLDQLFNRETPISDPRDGLTNTASGALGIKGKVDPISAHAMETAGADLSKSVNGPLTKTGQTEQIMSVSPTEEQRRAIKAQQQIEENRQ